MSNVTRVLGAAGNTQGIPLNSEDLFSTFVYTGNGSGQTIVNGIDLTEGGMVWVKTRSHSASAGIVDTETGASKYLLTSTSAAQVNGNSSITAFNSNGFDLGSSGTFNEGSGYQFVSWTFRKAPKFFDVVTWTGTGSAMTIDHNLGSVPGMIIVKSTSASYDWAVWHREFTGTTDYIKLNTSAAKTDSAGVFGNGSTYLTPTSTQFFVGGNNQVSGEVGGTYVAYLFAHNTTGGFGPTGDKNMISCGTYNGNGGNNQAINVGFEPQWLMIKNKSHSGNWAIFDMMRQFRGPIGLDSSTVYANDAAAESGIARVYPISTGFQFETETGATVNTSGNTYIYVAIAREMAVPTAATDVFSIDTEDGTEPRFDSNNHIVDLGLTTSTGGGSNRYMYTRVMDERVIKTDVTAQRAAASEAGFDFMNGHIDSQFSGSTSHSWMWKRAPKYFDIVNYSGTGSNRTQTHNLGVAPEMIWVHGINIAENWAVYHKDVGATKYLQLNSTNAEATSQTRWNNTAPTSSVFSLGADNEVNASSYFYIAYLFATLPGISKVGSYTGGTNPLTVDCGFTSGARFVLIKAKVEAAWFLFDSVRGIVAGSDPSIRLDNANAQSTGDGDIIDPHSSGFTLVTSSGDYNGSGREYIFYAIA